jgi:hypothetical protein
MIAAARALPTPGTAHDLGDFRLAGQVIIAGQHIGEREGACFQVG